VEVLDWVRAADGAEVLDGYARRLADVAETELARDGDALGAAAAIAALNDALTQRLLVNAEAEIGPPPCAYNWLALGSQGRREQSLLTDQDHALAYAQDDEATRGYFGELATRVTQALRRAGFPYCPGGYMAMNWHRSLAEWQRTFRAWLDKPSSQGVVEAEVFLDYRGIHGDLRLRSVDEIRQTAADRPQFLVLMARAAVTFRPPLWFGRLHGRWLDVKTAGLAPIVLLARLYALAGGSAATSTVDRLADGARAGHVSQQGAAQLTEAYRVLTRLRLESQVREVRAGRPATNQVRADEMPAPQRKQVQHALHVIRDHQRAVELRFHTETIS
jgi:CBS domain-containing protein